MNRIICHIFMIYILFLVPTKVIGQEAEVSESLYRQAIKEYINRESEKGRVYDSMYFDYGEFWQFNPDSVGQVKTIEVRQADLSLLLKKDSSLIIFKLWPIEINDKNENIIYVSKYLFTMADDYTYNNYSIINTLGVFFSFSCNEQKYLFKQSIWRTSE